MEKKYAGIRKAEARNLLPEIDLLPQILHEGRQLDVAVFGPKTYNQNLRDVQKGYFHSEQLPNISFNPATTSESICIAAYDFKNLAKPQVFDPRWLQAGRIVRTSEGVFANPPKDEKGNPITDERILKSFLNSAKPVKVGNGVIYVVSNAENLRDFGFADYDSFERGVQDCDTFSQGGLARVLEHSEDEAKNLRTIASPKFYKRGVGVSGFDSVKEPVLRVVGLDSDRDLGDSGLVVGGYWDDYVDGYAFGVLDKSAEGASQKNK